MGTVPAPQALLTGMEGQLVEGMGNSLWPLGESADGTLGSDKTLPLSESDIAYHGHPSLPPRGRKPHLAES